MLNQWQMRGFCIYNWLLLEDSNFLFIHQTFAAYLYVPVTVEGPEDVSCEWDSPSYPEVHILCRIEIYYISY